MRAEALALALVLAAPAWAQPMVVPIPAPLPSVPAPLVAAAAKAEAGDCAGALTIADPLVATTPPPGRLLVQRLRFLCLAQLNRFDEAATAQAELAAAGSREPAVVAFPVSRALAEKRYPQAADALEAIATKQPEALAGLNGTIWGAIASPLSQAGQADRADRLGLALARANWQPADGADLKGPLATSAIRTLIADDRAGEAEPFVDAIDRPSALFELAIQRRYEALWPSIEARLGPRSERAADRFAAPRLEALATRPTDAAVRRDGMISYILLGRLTDAIALGQGLTIADPISEPDFDTVLQHAGALEAAKRGPEGDERLRALAALDPAKSPYAIVAAVVLSERLIDDGDNKGALAVARDALTRSPPALAPFYRAWLRRSELCTVAALGPAQEARELGDRLRDQPGDNAAASIEGLLCAGRQAEAATLAQAQLATPAGAALLADQFQPGDAFAAAAPSKLRDLWAGLLRRPEVKVAFDRAARILPRPLWPARGERPIPRVTDAAGTT